MNVEINTSSNYGSFLDNRLHHLSDDLTRNSNASEHILEQLPDLEDSSLKELQWHLKIREKILVEKISELTEEKLKLKQNIVKESSALVSSHRMLLLTVLFGTIIITTSVFYVTELVNAKMNEILLDKIERLNTISTRVESDLLKLRSVVEASSSLPQVQNVSFANLIDKNIHGIPIDADQQKRGVANDIINTNNEILAVFFVLPNGDMYLSQPYHGQENMKDSNFAFRDWYHGVTKTHNTYVSELYVSQITNSKVIAISTPVYADSKYVGIWSIILNADFFISDLQNYLLAKNEQLIIIDKNKNIIYDSSHIVLNDNRIANLDYVDINDDGLANPTTDVQVINGIKSLVMTNHIHNENDHWRAILIQPYDDAFYMPGMFYDASLLAMVLFVVLVLALCITISFKLISKSRQIRKNIEHLGELQQHFVDASIVHNASSLARKQVNINKKIYILVIIAISLVGFNTYASFTSHIPSPSTPQLKSGFVIENLRGDTVDTWISWNITPNRILDVSFLNPDDVSQAQLDSVKDAISSENTVLVDDSVTHKGPKGEKSTYYTGWAGALKNAADPQTKLIIPTTFHVLDSAKGAGDIVFHFSKARNADGYTGYTNSLVDQNQILKATITIYDVGELTPEQIGMIARHEFGHAIGLAHSTAPEDLMAPIIATDAPYISECDISAVKQLYDGHPNNSIICEK